MAETLDVLVVGAGITGLATARRLHQAGLKVKVLEKESSVGGRMRSESFEGCILDHGFQVLLPAYPSYKKLRLGLQLQSFGRGAWCFSPGKRERFVDPLHHPIDFLRHLNQSPVGLSDMVSFAKLALTKPTNQSTHDYLEINGFSLKSRERFFRPFLRGILLDPDLRSPIEMSAFFMRMFLFGGTALPENGIQAFAMALAKDLDISLETEVFSIQGNDVETKNGDQFHAKVIVNTSPDLSPSNVQWLSSTCHYFLSRKSVPMQRNIGVFSSEFGTGLNHMANLTEIAPHNSPAGTILLSASSLTSNHNDAKIFQSQICSTLGLKETDLDYLKSFTIDRAVPIVRGLPAGFPDVPEPKVDGTTICASDTASYGSQHAALLSAEKAAKLAIKMVGG